MLKGITSQKDYEKKKRNMQTFLALFILGILALSTAGYALFSAADSSQSKKYGKISFTLTDKGWQGKGFNFVTSYLPQDVEGIPFSGRPTLPEFSGKVYFVTATSRIPAAEWVNAVPMQSFQLACLPEQANESGCGELPLKDCNDAAPQNAVIIFKDANETSATYTPGCLMVYGDETAAVKTVDKAIFLMNGVIK